MMVSRRIRGTSSAGFTVGELTVVIAIMGIIMALSAPLVYTYLSTSALTAGVDELSAILSNARQLAIRNNTTVCVTNNGTSVQFHVGTCAAAAWTGAGTDSAGFISLTNGVAVTAGPNIAFDYLGRATTAGTYTVTNPANGGTMSVIVSPTGRVRIGP